MPLEHLSFAQGASALIVIALFSYAGWLVSLTIERWIKTREVRRQLAQAAKLRAVNAALRKSMWGDVIPYRRINQPGCFQVRK